MLMKPFTLFSALSSSFFDLSSFHFFSFSSSFPPFTESPGPDAYALLATSKMFKVAGHPARSAR